MTTGVFVLHYAKDEVTNACLEALFASDDTIGRPGRPVWVIDNGSPKPFPLPSGSAPWRRIRLEENLPIIEAYNAAMRMQPADVYVCMANDTKPAPGMVQHLELLLKNRGVGIVAPGTNDRGAGVLWVPMPDDWDFQIASSVDNTCWAFRHDLTEAIGWPDCSGHTHQKCWGSNRDYCYRAREAGYMVLAARGAYIHKGHQGGLDMEAERAGQEWVQRKWGERWRDVWY